MRSSSTAIRWHRRCRIPNGDILGAEVYDPFIVTKVVASYSNPNLQNPNYENPNLENPNFENPNYENPNYENPNLQNPNYQNPNLENPNYENPNFENVTVQYPNLENPNLENSAFTAGETDYTDVTWEVTNVGNTTTGYDVSAFSSINTEGMNAQFFATRTYATPTVTNDCQVAPVAQNQVLFSIADPDLQNPNLENPNWRTARLPMAACLWPPERRSISPCACPGIVQPTDPDEQQDFENQFGLDLLAQPFNPGVVFDIDDPLGPVISGPTGEVTAEATGPLDAGLVYRHRHRRARWRCHAGVYPRLGVRLRSSAPRRWSAPRPIPTTTRVRWNST